MPDQPVNETAPSRVTVAQVHTEFEKLLKDRTHMGVRNFLGDAFLEPRNPFQRMRRQPKKLVVATGGIFLLGLFIVYGFHLR
jgi:superfamily II DNA/RNA helicase